MIFGYYNRIWLYRDLLWSIDLYKAPLFNNSLINTIQKEISNDLLTICDKNWEWWISFNKAEFIKNYLKKKWYWAIITEKFYSDVPYWTYDIEWIKREINAWRPVLLFMLAEKTFNNNVKEKSWWHIWVVYWYSLKNNSTRININFWWWKEYSNINMDMWAWRRFYFDWYTESYRPYWYIWFQIL